MSISSCGNLGSILFFRRPTVSLHLRRNSFGKSISRRRRWVRIGVVILRKSMPAAARSDATFEGNELTGRAMPVLVMRHPFAGLLDPIQCRGPVSKKSFTARPPMQVDVDQSCSSPTGLFGRQRAGRELDLLSGPALLDGGLFLFTHVMGLCLGSAAIVMAAVGGRTGRRFGSGLGMLHQVGNRRLGAALIVMGVRILVGSDLRKGRGRRRCNGESEGKQYAGLCGHSILLLAARQPYDLIQRTLFWRSSISSKQGPVWLQKE